MKDPIRLRAFCSLLPVAMALALAGPTWAQVIEHKLTASDGAAHDVFGFSVSLSENRALIGAWGDDDHGYESGSAYVFERQEDGLWIETAKLTAHDGFTTDWFGWSVSVSEDHAMVGAILDDDMGSFSGSVYVYERQEDSSWIEITKLTAPDGAELDEFGHSVSLVEDRVLVGSYWDDDQGTNSGSAYVFERREDGSWLDIAKIMAKDGSVGDEFGFSVSLSTDRALIGAPGGDEGIGSAYVFERDGDDSWIEVAKLISSDRVWGDRFGSSVSLSGNRALVGAYSHGSQSAEEGAAFVFERQGDGSWIETAKITASDGTALDRFGSSVSLSGDRALVGALFSDGMIESSGSAYMYLRQENGSWIEVGNITASDGASGDGFGISVSLSGDRALVGALLDDDLGSDSGSAYVFENIFPVAIETPADIPDNYHLPEPYPNPFNPQAQFSLEVSETQQVRIEIFNTLGQKVDVLYDGLLLSQGTHPFTFAAGSLPSGVYLLRVTGETFATTRTMTLVK